MRSLICALVVLSTVTGCATVSKKQYADLSAGAIGCPAEELVITGEKSSYGLGEMVAPWNAECRGHRFICSAAGQTVSCKEELKAVEAPSATPAAAQAEEGPQ
ncbi:hypothetical protein COCOR_02922 [Corallococcus coralloides DSM 2259]|uniref:Lipoprotein n=1 Tax=Corallococcus coralloides (strain ATCC 25202 / DSM 2259 / NBRC 100086 / M2) TaxID=1144275 RepID=H8MYR3_CORCM|nr:hypothetical protein [Corallococcus coralloides]AFE04920.1 hypothetical protein COCOR_02922 [Corallococcus coralloides DSM 2259]